MLQEIYISNFVLIDELRIQFSAGLNVLSGETGAGKSIIIDALGLIMGERVKNDWIRDDSRKAIAEAVFVVPAAGEAFSFLKDNGLVEEDEDTIIVTREIYPGGRSAARINRRNVTAGLLRELAALLLDMHLQHEHLSILKADKYIDYLDSFAEGAEVLLAELKLIFKELKESRDELAAIEAGRQDKQERLELLDYQINELQSAYLRAGEEEELSLLKNRIADAGKLLAGIDHVLNLLYSSERGENAYDLIAGALDTVNSLKAEEFFAGLAPALDEIYYSLEDIATKMASFRESLDFQPGQLEELEDRLYQINRLKKKYGGDVTAMLDYLEKARQEREELELRQESQEELQAKVTELDHNYRERAAELSGIRAQAAALLEEQVHNELIQLNMPHVRFVVKLEHKDAPGIKGMDQADYLFSPNPGEVPASLARIASGGELSRFVLALKTVLAEVYQVPTMIFDEIDVGVGGSALTAMARKLAQMAANHQIILVTHAPQIASFAETHYLIEKQIEDETTLTRIKLLNDSQREKEIARMLAGDNVSPVTLEHAREILNQAKGIG